MHLLAKNIMNSDRFIKFKGNWNFKSYDQESLDRFRYKIYGNRVKLKLLFPVLTMFLHSRFVLAPNTEHVIAQ